MATSTGNPTPTVGDVLDAYRSAVEAKNYAGLQDVYADDAEYVVYNERNRPSSASTVRGAEAIRALFEQEPEGLKHRVSDEVVGEGSFAFTLTCTYPTGGLVVATCVSSVVDGRIARQTGVEAWDV